MVTVLASAPLTLYTINQPTMLITHRHFHKTHHLVALVFLDPASPNPFHHRIASEQKRYWVTDPSTGLQTRGTHVDHYGGVVVRLADAQSYMVTNPDLPIKMLVLSNPANNLEYREHLRSSSLREMLMTLATSGHLK